MAFQPEAFGKYFLIDKIAVGGMAEIFKAKQFGPGGFEKVLVIKRILSHLGEDEEFIQMFRDEAMISSTLTHSNIIHVYDFGKVRNHYFIAMEYCEGRDLKTVMKKCQEIGRPLPIEYAVYIIHEVCKGLDYAHRKKDSNNQDMNILHRDISPSNVMMSYEEGKVKLADFGIAKAQNASYKTKAGVLKGKFEYMSPEQASGLSVDRRSDIFAVGVSFYELLTRRRLFKTDSDLKTLELIRNPIIPPPSHLNPQVNEELDAIVMKALARRPEDRYQEAWQLQHDLREYMRSCSPPTSPDLIALSLANFMREIFDREIQLERERLESGTRTARELMSNIQTMPPEKLDDDMWDPPPSQTGQTGMTANPSNTSVKLMIAEKQTASDKRPMTIAVAAAVVVVVGGVFLFSDGSSSSDARTGGPNGQVIAQSGQGGNGTAPGNSGGGTSNGAGNTGAAGTASQPGDVNSGTTSSLPGGTTSNLPGENGNPLNRNAVLRLNIEPYGAKIFLDNKYIGDSPRVSEEFPLGRLFELRAEKEGYQRHTESILVQQGERRDISLRLSPVAAAPAPTPKKAPAPAPVSVAPPPQPVASSGRLEFVSNPAQVTVMVNGRALCVTPCAMENGQGGESYAIEFSAEGYAPFQTRVRFPSSGSQQVSASLGRIEKGYLTLSIKDSLSAELFVNGQAKGYNAYWDKISLPAGRHTIKLRNQVAGLEKTFAVEIEPGKEARVTGVELLPKE